MKNKENIDIAFVILHYYTYNDTCKCIESIMEKIGTDKYRIIVVDNASQNDSFIKLNDKYSQNEKIILIHNETNLGFANGNNIGFKYIKDKFNAKFIALINNDTYLIQDDFFKLIENEYEYSKFDVLGPKILLPNNEVNPIQKKLISVSELNKVVFRYKLIYIFNLLYIGFIYDNIKYFIKKIFKIKTKSAYSKEGINIRQENIVLHGAFLIFSEKYINTFDGLNDKTFMYMEEKILAATLKKHRMKSVYNPNIIIFHNEDSSTNAVNKNKRKKILFVYKNAIKSSKVLKELLEEIK